MTVTPGGLRAVTNTEGEYAIAGLAPGAYTVTVNFVGLQGIREDGERRGGTGHARRARRSTSPARAR